jgi:hypothetical protein
MRSQCLPDDHITPESRQYRLGAACNPQVNSLLAGARQLDVRDDIETCQDLIGHVL